MQSQTNPFLRCLLYGWTFLCCWTATSLAWAMPKCPEGTRSQGSMGAVIGGLVFAVGIAGAVFFLRKARQQPLQRAKMITAALLLFLLCAFGGVWTFFSMMFQCA